MTQGPKDIFLIAGEASGDLHGSSFMRSLKELCPYELRFHGIGGPLMIEQGLKAIYPMERLSVVGVTEVVRQGAHIFRAYRRVKRALKEIRPSLVVFIDYPGFNLKVLKLASQMGLSTMYYITPQVWAWKKRRVHLLRRFCSVAAVILPFEEPFLKRAGVNATFVGHPLVDTVRQTMEKGEFLRSLGLDPKRPTLGLLPGSRAGELARHIPIMLETVSRIKRMGLGVQFIMPLTRLDLLKREEREAIEKRGIIALEGKTYDAMGACDCLILASGTVTLEASILGVPHIVIYRLSAITYLLGRMLVKVPYVSLTNLIRGEAVVEEYIQHRATPENLAMAVERLFKDDVAKERVKHGLREVKERLGPGGASKRAARLALDLL